MRRTLLLLAFGIVLGAVALFAVSRVIGHDNPRRIDTSRAAVIRDVRALGRLETASYTIEKIVEAGSNEGRLESILFRDRILLIAHGEVIAGFDLAETKEEDVRVTGTTMQLRLPSPRVLVSSLDNAQTRVYDRDQGLLTKGDKDLEAEARQAAEASIRQAACDAGILDEASENARKQLRAFFGALGYTEVVIDIPQGSCA